MRTTLHLILGCLLTAQATAQPVIEVVDLGGGALDMWITSLNGGTRWTTAGLAGSTYEGATFEYAYDANNTQQLVSNEVCINATYVNAPIGISKWRCTLPPRRAYLAGRYLGGTGEAIATEDRLDVAYFDPPGGDQFGTGRLARVVLGIEDTGFPLGDVFATIGEAPSGTTVLASGVFTATTDAWVQADLAEVSWSIYAVPEPGTLALLGLVIAGGLRRPRWRCGT